MRIIKIAGIVVGALVALLVLVIVAVVLFVDPNDYRGRIEQIVQDSTGRKLTLSGDLKLSIFPWLAVQTGAASLGEAPGFGDEPFVSIEEARAALRLMPLLSGTVEVGNVRLVGARIRLITDEQGRNNYDDLGKKDAAASPEAPSAGPVKIPTIAGLEIENAAVTIEDRKTKTLRIVRKFNLKSGALQSGKPFDLSTRFIFDQNEELSVNADIAATVTADFERNVHVLAAPKIDLNITGLGYPAAGVPVQIRATSVQADVGNEIHQLLGLTLSTTWKGEGFPAAGVPVSLKADDLNVNLAKQALQLSGLAAEVAGAKLSGALSGTEVVDAPKIGGNLRLEPVVLREWLPKLGVSLPKTRDATVFGKLGFASKVALTKSSAELNDVTLQLDDTTAKGMLGVADFDAKALRFDLSIDKLNADRYLPPPVEGEAAPAKKPDPAQPSPPTPIPVEALRTLNARGQIQVAQAVFSGIQFTKLRLGINARDGKVRLNPSEASMYGGQYRGDIGIDATGPLAKVSLDEHISNIDFAPLFKDFFKSERVSGKGTANIKLTGTGKTTDDIVNTLDGVIDFKVADGALEGTDLWWEIRRARALIKQQAIPEAPTKPRTPFSALQGTAVASAGVLTNNDLDVSTQYLKVGGKGNVDLPKSTLDYRLVATVLKFPREGAAAATANEQDLVDAQVPVKITGKLSDPKVRPDLEAFVKGQVKEKVKEKLQDKLLDLLKR